MNMILHGIEAPNILHTNTLTENLAGTRDDKLASWEIAFLPAGVEARIMRNGKLLYECVVTG